MEIKVIKRNKEKAKFNRNKIVNAIKKANLATHEDFRIAEDKIEEIVDSVVNNLSKVKRPVVEVEEIQDLVEVELMKAKAYILAQNYIHYRSKRTEQRTNHEMIDKIFSLVNGTNEEMNTENANKEVRLNSTKRDYISGIVSTETLGRMFEETYKKVSPKGKEIIKHEDLEKIIEADKKGAVHFHDKDYFIQSMYNCALINLEDMLQNGTVISGTTIDKPNSFYTAANITTQIIAQVASNQYGGQSITLSHLAPFVDISRQKFIKEVRAEFENNRIEVSDEKIKRIAERRLKKEIEQGVQTIQYQITTLMTTNGQAPFLTVFLYTGEVEEGQTRDDLALIIEEVLRQRIKGVKDENGTWVNPTFPKLIFALDEDNVPRDSKYRYLFDLAAECSSKRMVPDYISVKKMKELKKGDVYPPMGCRSLLTPDDGTANSNNKSRAKNYVEGEHKYYGRFNQGVVTLNLPFIALESKGNMKRFWELFDEYTDLAHSALRLRHERLLGTTTEAAPILWEYGAIARLNKGEKIDKLLYGNYSTISLGYAGIYEMTQAMLGKSHTTEEGRDFALEVMQKLNDKCEEWKEDENISYSIYGTPMEAGTYKFAKALKKEFGIIPEVSEYNYITNSYHINVREEVSAVDKIVQEGHFQELSPGGAISYVEVPNLSKNLDVVKTIMEAIYDNTIYAEINTKMDHCDECGYDGEIFLVEDKYGELVWECPNCGNRNVDSMNVVRRVCGYLGNAAKGLNTGRTQEIHDRVLHVSNLVD